MEELAESLDADTESLLNRWEGRPDLIIEDVFRVRDLDTKDVSDLELTPYQRQAVHAFWYGDESTINVLKGRRTGYSFIFCASILLSAMTTPHGFYAITGPSKSQAKDRIEDIYDIMEWARVGFDPVVDNRDEIELQNGSTIMAFSGNPDTSRGADSADVLFVDEMDFLEDQEESMRAFSPFVALGDAKTVEISTPNLENGLFMQEQERGSPNGSNGIISIEQAAFENPDEIDTSRSLFVQDVEPVMPYLNLQEAEKARARDPNGFEQEYLCKPVQNQYRFFDEQTVDAALSQGARDSYLSGPSAAAGCSGKIVMAVDIAGGGKDDTAITIVEHKGSKRNLRYTEVVTDSLLGGAGIEPANARNPSAIAERIHQLYVANGVDRVVTDATNIGEGFDSEIREKIGRGVSSVNFSDREAIADMWGDVNYGFHNGQITLVDDDDDTLRDQLLAIVKDKTTKGSTARFSGKDHAPEGKDDLAVSFALAAYPPNLNTGDKNLSKKEEQPSSGDIERDSAGVPNLDVDTSPEESSKVVAHARGSTSSEGPRRDYQRRHARR